MLAVVVLGAMCGPAEARSTTDFGAGWRFTLSDPAGAQAPGFDDSAWRSVRLPHDWSIELDPTPTGGTNSGTGFLAGGTGWYRKTFTLPTRDGRQAAVARVRRHLHGLVGLRQRRARGTHPYGYTGFAVDLTARVHAGANVVAVRVNNQLPEQPLVLGQRHLPQRAPRGDRPGPRGAPRRVRHDAGRSRTRSAPGYAHVHVDTRVEGGDATVGLDRPRRARPARRAGERDATCASATRICGRPRTRTSTRSTPRWSPRHRVVDRVSTRFGIRWFRIDPNQGLYLNGQLPEGLRRRPAPRPGRARRGDQPRCARAPDEDHEVDGRQRVPDVPQPAVARDDRRLPGARDRDDGRGVRHLARPKVQFDYGRFFDANSDADIKEMVNARQELAGGDPVVDRQRDPRLDASPRASPIAQRLIDDITLDRHDAPDRHRLGPVPQRPGRRIGRRPDPRAARRPRPQLQHRRVGGRAARALPGQVPVRVRVLVGDLDARRLPGPRAS